MAGSSNTNGHSAATPVNGVHGSAPLTTLPGPDHDYKISLQNKVIAIIAVTGANQGIGLGIAEVCLANDAACVYSLDVSKPGEPFEALVKRFPGRLEFQTCDVTEPDSITAAIDAIIDAQGRFDGMVANAGATKHQPALDFTREQFEGLFKLNVFGAWNCATAAARAFIKLGCKGSIAAPSAPYGATKGAVRNMTHTLAMEWAEHGIRVNSISPGFVKTALTYYVETSPDWGTKMKYYGGMPRLALPQELGGAYVYLLSETATYTTGIDIPIAGVVGAW
ncbi:hypothetical protein F66182_995 [Fusarium sp. NRRL 66182]|nr:hypothetical protein F66182_995 [Fusarium sp. NRRL 66182]